MVTKAHRDSKKYRQALEDIQLLTEVKSPIRQIEFYTNKLRKIQKIVDKALRETS